MKRLLLLALLLSGCQVTSKTIVVCQKICTPHDGLNSITAGDKFICWCKSGRHFDNIQAKIILEHVGYCHSRDSVFCKGSPVPETKPTFQRPDDPGVSNGRR